MRKSFPEAGPLTTTVMLMVILTGVQLLLGQLSFSLYLLWAPHIALVFLDAVLTQSFSNVLSGFEFSGVLAMQLLFTLLAIMCMAVLARGGFGRTPVGAQGGGSDVSNASTASAIEMEGRYYVRVGARTIGI